MSRSAPTETSSNPSVRFLEWKGGEGALTYYDKTAQKREFLKGPFKFLVLDVLSTVTGFNEKHEAGIYSNEVRDVRAHPLLVKVFKGGQLGNGLWESIKDRVKAEGGKFAASVYIAFREGKEEPLQIGNIKMSGCALSPWFDFRKAHRKDIETDKAVVMKAGAEEKKGGTKFFPPTFALAETTAETNAEAIALDKQLQDYLKGYLKRPVDETLDQRTSHQPEDENQDYEEAEATARRPHPSDPDDADLGPSDNDW